MLDYLRTFEPMEDVVVELERLFMFLVWEERALPFVTWFIFLCFPGSCLFS